MDSTSISRLKPFVLGIASFVGVIASSMISIDIENSKWITLIRILIITFSSACYLLCYNSTASFPGYKHQLSWINMIVLLVLVLYCSQTFLPAISVYYRSQVYFDVIWMVTLCFVFWKSRHELTETIKELHSKDTMFYSFMALSFAVVLIILSYDVDGPHFVYDANSFYERLRPIGVFESFSIRNLFVFSHCDISYFFPIFLLGVLFNNLKWGYFTYGALCLIAASFGVVFLLKDTIKNRTKLYLVMASFACLFSPCICGMSTYYTYDYAICCFAPLLILFAVKNEWLYFFSLAVYISLLKETGLVFVGSVCAGIVVKELLCDGLSIRSVLLRFRTISWGLIVLLFGVFYKSYAGWGSDYGSLSGFEIDREHIIKTLRMFLVLNLEWVIVLLLFGCGLVRTVIGIRSKSRGGAIKYLPICVICAISALLFLLFNLIYKTVEFPRYTESFPICLLLALVVLLSEVLTNVSVRFLAVLGISVLSAVSCFTSFDPVSEALFPTALVGNGKIYFSCMTFDFGGDPGVYNRQYYGMDIVYNRALKKGLDSGDDLIAVSSGNNTGIWPIDGGMYDYDQADKKRVFTEFWNVIEDRREPVYEWDYIDNPEYIQMDLRFIYPIDDVVDALKGRDSFIYLYLPTQNGEKEEKIRQYYEVVEEGSYSSHGWVMSYIRGKPKQK